MVALEEQEVLQQRNQNPLRLHGVVHDARRGRQRASHHSDVGDVGDCQNRCHGFSAVPDCMRKEPIRLVIFGL